MKTFSCTCGQLVFFQNVFCIACKKELGFLPGRPCAMHHRARAERLFHGSCKYFDKVLQKVPELRPRIGLQLDDSGRRNKRSLLPILPAERSDSRPDHQRQPLLWAPWKWPSAACYYTLLSLQLPLSNKLDDPHKGLTFRFLSDVTNADGTVTRFSPDTKRHHHAEHRRSR